MSTHDIHANIVLDLKGLTCPAPLLGAKKLVDDLREGQILLLISDCKGTQDDLFAWARQTGNQVLKTLQMPGGGTGYYIMKGKDKDKTFQANVTLDIRGVACPGPIIEAKKLLNGMKSGEVLKLVSNCPGVQSDITSWAAATGMKLLDTVKVTADDYEFYIQKA
jgi:TusA-related sulfurtransferase